MAKEKFKNSLEDALSGYWVNYTGWGRATRAEFWWCYLFYSIILSSFFSIVDYTFSSELLEVVWFLVTLVPGFCLTARRLHDTGRSNWNILWYFLPIVGWIIMLVYFCQAGDKKANKWGKPRI